ncbi:quercetin dioxygenase-like cupin family protein [Ancylobacter aquaticus]|uniref:Quercetin dioxygenase-like cupin family protein n=1 Tax=Ancylobacter aquaticus TaxID=100 RepID=A0A4R1I8F8_ANCAQ|nr:cupin domain-containing protein [Ancylobacter aquaticus]TCK30403.1 quercetin dioxygenase-like cupin family protein [Ancylobacter aquaticus]
MKYFHRFEDMEQFAFGPSVTSSFGAKVPGERMILGLARKTPGTGSKPHKHNAEQFNYMVQGTVHAIVGDEEMTVTKGGVVYIPAGVVHTITAIGDEDVVFLTVKDKLEEFKVELVGVTEDTA